MNIFDEITIKDSLNFTNEELDKCACDIARDKASMEGWKELLGVRFKTQDSHLCVKEQKKGYARLVRIFTYEMWGTT